MCDDAACFFLHQDLWTGANYLKVFAVEIEQVRRRVDSSQVPVNVEWMQTRWGVGFGPRDCSDYQTGISIIPIERLTEADRKWMLTAEYGGTGGKPIESGMVVEEPDIEIGAGVSSKGSFDPATVAVYPP